MKRIACVVFAALLLASLAACTGKIISPDAPEFTAAPLPTVVPAATDTPAEATEALALPPVDVVDLPAPASGMTRFMSEAADLDGDGDQEYVLVDSDEERQTVVTVLSGAEMTSYMIDYPYAPRLYELHSFWNDGTGQIVVSGDTGSDDYTVWIFRYANGSLTQCMIDGYPETLNEDGTLVVSTNIDVLGTYGGTSVYTLNADMTAVRSTDFTIETYDGFEKDRLITVKMSGLTGENAAGETVKLPKGTTLLLKSTDAESYALCSTSLGEDVKLSISRAVNDWQWYIGGKAESTWFGELMYAG